MKALGLWVCLCLGVAMVSPVLGAEAATQPVEAPPATQPSGSQVDLPAGRPMVFDQVIQKGDRLLFVGDEVTQQMFYTRAVAAALLAVKPQAGLRIYNGGYDGATAGSAMKWIDDLLELTQPTVVFVCLGLNDGQAQGAEGDVVGLYRKNLSILVDRIRAKKEVRQVILLTPPAIGPGADAELMAIQYPAMLKKLARETIAVAVEKKIGAIDLLTYLEFVYDKAAGSPGQSLTIGGRMPSDLGHAVIASVILKGIGLESQRLDPIGWSPLPARKMARVRSALALQLRAPEFEKAQVSQDMVVAVGRFDEAFFRAWRLAGRTHSTGSRSAALMTAEQAWQQVVQLTEEAYGQAASKERGVSSPSKD